MALYLALLLYEMKDTYRALRVPRVGKTMRTVAGRPQSPRGKGGQNVGVCSREVLGRVASGERASLTPVGRREHAAPRRQETRFGPVEFPP